MRILFCIHKIMDLGGIINHTEHLARGFKALGHEVSLVRLEWAEHLKKSNYTDTTYDARSVFSTEAYPVQVSQRLGWTFSLPHPSANAVRFPYQGEYAMRAWREYAKQFDMIIWTVPTPTRAGWNAGNTDWVKLFKLPKDVTQVAIVHDGNMLSNYPCIVRARRYFKWVVGVHNCALEDAKKLGDNTAMILNPQMPRDWHPAITSWHRRARWVGMCQTFKRWKRVDDVLRALPHGSFSLELMGGGIEQRYMVSADKVKPAYRGIWQSANATRRMCYHGFVDEKYRDNVLDRCRVFIDSSWSKKYAARGAHFNRSTVDAMLMGCVPMARVDMMDDNIFVAGENYLPLPGPKGVHDKEVAKAIDDALDLSSSKASRIIRNGLATALRFDAVKIAEQYLALMKMDSNLGHPSREAVNASNETWKEFYDV